MSIFKAIGVKVGKNASLKGIINYVLQPKKTEEQLTTGFCCDVSKALETFKETKQCFGKLEGRQYYHFVQSFPPNENITAQQAHDVAVQFAERCKKFWGFEMIIVTHKDRDHLHTHFVMNSVNFINGRKFHFTRKELAAIKELQNQVSIEFGYSPAPQKGFDIFGKKRTEVSADNSKIYKILKKGQKKEADSYLLHCSEAVLKTMGMARSKEQFIQLMHAQGFATEWKDNKKHITFTDKKRKAAGERKCKVRLSKLAQYFPALNEFTTKENLLDGIQRNRIEEPAQSDHNGLVAARSDSNKFEIERSPELIDFNTGFEKYSARVDAERTKHTVEKATRLSGGMATATANRTGEQQGTTQGSTDGIQDSIQKHDGKLSEKYGKSAKKNQRGESRSYSR